MSFEIFYMIPGGSAVSCEGLYTQGCDIPLCFQQLFQHRSITSFCQLLCEKLLSSVSAASAIGGLARTDNRFGPEV